MHVPLTEVILRHAGAELARATLPPGEYVIGREPGVDLRADTPLLSRQHARLTINYDHLLLEDLGSSNGTFVNDRPLAEPTRLFPNQSIRLGPDITLEVRRQRAPTEPGVSLAPAQGAIARHLPAELLGEKRYTIGGVVAQGGMGAILDARQNANQRTVAMKVMLETGDEAAVLRFIEEAQITSQLEHPNIVPIYELGVDEQGQVFYTMKMVRGITLKKVLELIAAGTDATVKKYPLHALLTIFQKVCDALAFAHSKGVLHRDLKPENLMLGDFGSVLVMDWGLAKVIGKMGAPGADITRSIVMSARGGGEFGSTMAGSIMGTPTYMSPEQARGEVETLDARSDIYALGAILFEILHLRPVVRGSSALIIVDKVQRGEVEWTADQTESGKRKAEIPAGLLAVCHKALAFDPAARYRHVGDLQADLLAYQTGFATSAERAGVGKQLLLALKRHKVAALGAAAVLVVGAGFGTKAFLAGRRAERALTDLRATVPAFVAQADSLMVRGDAETALLRLGNALALDPANVPAHVRRGNVLEALRRFDEAAAAYAKALQLAPHHPCRQQRELCLELIAGRSPAGEYPVGPLNELFDKARAQGRTGDALRLAEPLRKSMEEKLPLWQAKLDEWLGKNAPKLELLPGGQLRLYLARLALTDLSPLSGIPLSDLVVANNKITDLSPLSGMPLVALTAEHNALADLSPLRGMKLRYLSIAGNKVRDLSPLRGMPLELLSVDGCHDVTDLTPIQGAPLVNLNIAFTKVRDLVPIRGTKLENFEAATAPIADFSPIRGMPIKTALLESCSAKDVVETILTLPNLERLTLSAAAPGLEKLRALPNLKEIGYYGLVGKGIQPVAEFWADYDAQHKAGAK